MKNHNYIKGIPSSENSRGYKMHVAYLEPGIKESKIFDDTIQFAVVTYDFIFERGNRYKRG